MENEEFQKRRTDSASSRVSIQLLNQIIDFGGHGGHQQPRHQVVFVSYLRLLLKQVKKLGMTKPIGSNSAISVRMSPAMPENQELQVLLELPQVSLSGKIS